MYACGLKGKSENCKGKKYPLGVYSSFGLPILKLQHKEKVLLVS